MVLRQRLEISLLRMNVLAIAELATDVLIDDGYSSVQNYLKAKARVDIQVKRPHFTFTPF